MKDNCLRYKDLINGNRREEVIKTISDLDFHNSNMSGFDVVRLVNEKFGVKLSEPYIRLLIKDVDKIIGKKETPIEPVDKKPTDKQTTGQIERAKKAHDRCLKKVKDIRDVIISMNLKDGDVISKPDVCKKLNDAYNPSTLHAVMAGWGSYGNSDVKEILSGLYELVDGVFMFSYPQKQKARPVKGSPEALARGKKAAETRMSKLSSSKIEEFVPYGDYKVFIIDSEFDNKNSLNIKFTFEIIDGKYKGRKIIDVLNLKEISRIQRSVGVIHMKDTIELHNIPFAIWYQNYPDKVVDINSIEDFNKFEEMKTKQKTQVIKSVVKLEVNPVVITPKLEIDEKSKLESTLKSYDGEKKKKIRLKTASYFSNKESDVTLALESQDFKFVKLIPNSQFYIFERNLDVYKQMLKSEVVKEHNILLFPTCVSAASILGDSFHPTQANLDFCNSLDTNLPLIKEMLPMLNWCNVLAFTFSYMNGGIKYDENVPAKHIKVLQSVLPDYELMSTMPYSDTTPMHTMVWKRKQEATLEDIEKIRVKEKMSIEAEWEIINKQKEQLEQEKKMVELAKKAQIETFMEIVPPYGRMMLPAAPEVPVIIKEELVVEKSKPSIFTSFFKKFI